MIGERTAEELKVSIGCVYPKFQDSEMEVRGRDLITGLPTTIPIHSSEIMKALEEPAGLIVDAVHSVLEKTPPELSADICDRGIFMTGGGCLIDGLDKLLEEKLGIPVSTAINMLYKQIIITQSLPFKLSLNNRPKARDEMTDEEFNSMLKLSLKQAKENKGYDIDEAFDVIEKNDWNKKQ